MSVCLVAHFAVNMCLGVHVFLQAFITTAIDGGVVGFKLRPLCPPAPPYQLYRKSYESWSRYMVYKLEISLF